MLSKHWLILVVISCSGTYCQLIKVTGPGKLTVVEDRTTELSCNTTEKFKKCSFTHKETGRVCTFEANHSKEAFPEYNLNGEWPPKSRYCSKLKANFLGDFYRTCAISLVPTKRYVHLKYHGDSFTF